MRDTRTPNTSWVDQTKTYDVEIPVKKQRNTFRTPFIQHFNFPHKLARKAIFHIEYFSKNAQSRSSNAFGDQNVDLFINITK